MEGLDLPLLFIKTSEIQHVRVTAYFVYKIRKILSLRIHLTESKPYDELAYLIHFCFVLHSGIYDRSFCLLPSSSLP